MFNNNGCVVIRLFLKAVLLDWWAVDSYLVLNVGRSGQVLQKRNKIAHQEEQE